MAIVHLTQGLALSPFFVCPTLTDSTGLHLKATCPGKPPLPQARRGSSVSILLIALPICSTPQLVNHQLSLIIHCLLISHTGQKAPQKQRAFVFRHIALLPAPNSPAHTDPLDTSSLLVNVFLSCNLHTGDGAPPPPPRPANLALRSG